MGEDADVRNPSAPRGKDGKYAQREFERRFLLAGMIPGPVERTIEIHDRYIAGTRLRLRRAIEQTAGHDAQLFHKLTQKVPGPDGGPGLITTMYLSDEEYERLAAVPALVIEKSRSSVHPFGIDAFRGPLAGLFLAEAEFSSSVELGRLAVPPWAIAEVTTDARFSGGRLAATTSVELAAVLGEFGIPSRSP